MAKQNMNILMEGGFGILELLYDILLFSAFVVLIIPVTIGIGYRLIKGTTGIPKFMLQKNMKMEMNKK